MVDNPISKRAPLLIAVSDLKTRRTERRNPFYPPNEVSGSHNKLIEVSFRIKFRETCKEPNEFCYQNM